MGELQLSGAALTFETYSTALATMSGGRILAPFFFLMMLSLGISSSFALTEQVTAAVPDDREGPAAICKTLSVPQVTA